MKIGIDIDGVLTNTSEFMINCGKKYAQKIGKGKLIDKDAYDVIDMFGWDEEITIQFWEENIFEYAKNNPAIPFASETIQKLQEEGNEIIIITARLFSNKLDQKGTKMRRTVKQWLKENQIPYDKILFSKEDKELYCESYKVEIMIEDSPKNIYELSKKRFVICMGMPYNKQVQGDKIIRCKDWKEIYDQIQQLKLKNKNI